MDFSWLKQLSRSCRKSMGERRLNRIAEAVREKAWPTDDEVIAAILSVPCHYADLTITATSVKKGTGANIGRCVFGETITHGMPLYKNASDVPKDRFWKGQADGTEAEADVLGISMCGGAADQEGLYVSSGEYYVGATVVPATDYFLSTVAGMIAVRGDLTTSAHRVVRLFRARTAAIAIIDIKNYKLAAA